MKNSIIISYQINDKYKFIVDMFESTKAMAKFLSLSENHCRSIICRKIIHKGYIFERIWFHKNSNSSKGDDER